MSKRFRLSNVFRRVRNLRSYLKEIATLRDWGLNTSRYTKRFLRERDSWQDKYYSDLCSVSWKNNKAVKQYDNPNKYKLNCIYCERLCLFGRNEINYYLSSTKVLNERECKCLIPLVKSHFDKQDKVNYYYFDNTKEIKYLKDDCYGYKNNITLVSEKDFIILEKGTENGFIV
jgi:hypothetical protein